MLYDGSEPAMLFPRLFQSVTYLSAVCVIIFWNILLHKCFTNSMYFVKNFRRQVCLFDLVLSLSNKIKYCSLLYRTPSLMLIVYFAMRLWLVRISLCPEVSSLWSVCEVDEIGREELKRQPPLSPVVLWKAYWWWFPTSLDHCMLP